MAAAPPPGGDEGGDDSWAPGFERPYEFEEARKKKDKDKKKVKPEYEEGEEEKEEGTGGDDIAPDSGDTDAKTPPKKAETIRGTPTVTQPGLNLAERTVQETTAEFFSQWAKAEQMMGDDLEAGKYTKEQIEEIKTLMAASKKKMGMSDIDGKEEAMTVEQLKERIAKLEKDLKEKGMYGDKIIAQLLELQDQMKQVEIARLEAEKREAKYKEHYTEAMAKVDAATKEQRERKERTDKEREEEIRQAEARILEDALRDKEIAVNLLQRRLTAKEEELDRVNAKIQEEKESSDREAAIRKEVEIKKEVEIIELQKQAFQKNKKVKELIQELKLLHEKDNTVVLQQELDAKQKELDRIETEGQKEKESLNKEAEKRGETEIKKEAEITELQREALQKDEKVKELTKELGALHEKDDTIILLQQQVEAKQKELDRIEAERQDGKLPSDKEADIRREAELKKEAEITELQRVALQKDEKINELTKKLEDALLPKDTERALYHTGEKYVDAVKRLERENLEFRKQISKLEKLQGELESKNAELEVSAIRNIDEKIMLEIRAADGDAAIEKLKVWQAEEELQVARMDGLLLERRNLAIQVTRQEDQVIAQGEQIKSLTVTVEQLQAVISAGPDGAGADNILLRKQLEELGTEVAELKQQLESSKQVAIEQELVFTIKHTKVVDEYENLKKRLEELSNQKEEALLAVAKNKKEMKDFEHNKNYYINCAVEKAEEILKKDFQKQIEEYQLQEAKTKQELEATTEELEDIKEDLAAAEKGQPTNTTKINELKKDFQKQMEGFQLQEAKTKQELEAIKEDREAIKEELAIARQGQAKILELQQEIAALKSQLQEARRGLGVVRLRGQLQKYKEELAEAKESIEDLKQQLTAKEQQPGGDDGAKESEISLLKQEVEKLESEIARLKQIGEEGPQGAELSNLRREVAQLREQEENWKTESNLLILDMQQSVDVINELSAEQKRLNGVVVVLKGKLAESVTNYETAKNAWRMLEAKVLASATTGGASGAGQNQQAQAKRIQQLIDENKKLRELAEPGTGTRTGTEVFAQFSKRKAQTRLENIQMLMGFMVLQRALHGFVSGDMDSVLAAVDQATIEASLVGDQRLIVEVAFWATIVEYYLDNLAGALLGFGALKDSEQWRDEERDLVNQWIQECEKGSGCPKEKLGYKEAIQIGPLSDALKRPPRRPSDKARREAKKAKKAAKKAAKKDKKAQRKSKRAPAPKRIPRRELYVGILSEGQQKIWDTIDFGDFDYEKLTTQQQSLFSFEPIEYEPDSPQALPPPPPDDIAFYKLPPLPPSRPDSETSAGRPPRDEEGEGRPSRMVNVTANAALHIQFLTARLANREARIQELENMHADILTITAQLDDRNAQIQELRRHNQVMIAELTIWRQIAQEQEGQDGTWWARIRI